MSIFHKHQWRLISAQDYYDSYYEVFYPYSLHKDPKTRIILKCELCTKLRTELFTGHLADDFIKNYEEKK